MARFVHDRARAAVIAAAVVAASAGCGGVRGTARPAGGPSAPPAHAAGRAVLAPADVADEGFLPAGWQHVFTGLRPRDPVCARMLALADLRRPGIRAEDAEHAVFYRPQPPATLAVHRMRLERDGARRYAARARAAVAGCPLIRIRPGSRRVVLERSRGRRPAEVRDAVAVAYTGPGRGGIDLSMLWARSGGDVVVVAAAGEDAAGPAVRKIAARAVRGLLGERRADVPDAEPDAEAGRAARAR